MILNRGKKLHNFLCNFFQVEWRVDSLNRKLNRVLNRKKNCIFFLPTGWVEGGVEGGGGTHVEVDLNRILNRNKNCIFFFTNRLSGGWMWHSHRSQFKFGSQKKDRRKSSTWSWISYLSVLCEGFSKGKCFENSQMEIDELLMKGTLVTCASRNQSWENTSKLMWRQTTAWFLVNVTWECSKYPRYCYLLGTKYTYQLRMP